MSSPSPNISIKRFKENVNEHTLRFNALASVVQHSSGTDGFTPKKLRRALATDYFFRVATDWQLFQHEWTVNAIAHMPDRFTQRFQEMNENELKKTEILTRTALFTNNSITLPPLPKPVSQYRVRKILDDSGRNIEFSTSEKWKKFAIANLSDPHKGKLVRLLTRDENSSFLDLVRQLRNYIAHRSSTSMTDVQKVISPRDEGGTVGLVGPANIQLAVERTRNIRDIGTYLDRGDTASTPAVIIADRLQGISELLRWSK